MADGGGGGARLTAKAEVKVVGGAGAEGAIARGAEARGAGEGGADVAEGTLTPNTD